MAGEKTSAAPSLTREAMGIVDGLPLEIADESPAALRDDLQRLLDIEAIKRVKHAYFRCIDTGNFEELATLFHPEVTVHFRGGTYEWKLQGRDESIGSISESFHTRSIGHHNGHHPEIEILSATEATGVWYLADHMWLLNHNNCTTGTAIYWDRYEKVDGRWLVRDTQYERLYERNERLTEEPRFDAHYLRKCGTLPPSKCHRRADGERIRMECCPDPDPPARALLEPEGRGIESLPAYH